MDVNTLAKQVIADYKADQEVQYGIRAVFSVVGDTAPRLAERVLELEVEKAELLAALANLWELTFDFDVRDSLIQNAQDKDFRLGEYEPCFDNQEHVLDVLWTVAELLGDHAYMGTAKRTPHDRR